MSPGHFQYEWNYYNFRTPYGSSRTTSTQPLTLERPYRKLRMMLRRALVPLLLVAASVVLFFAGLEIALRLINHPRTEAKVLCLDAIMGNVYCPNLNERLDNLYGSTIQVRTNSMGMADREYPLEKPAGTLRIALLGDSLTASLYLPVEQQFKTLWEKALSQRLGKPVEIMNFAVDGTGTWEQLQMFHLRARQFQPDAVILAFFWGNDTWGNLASRDRGRANPLKDEYPEAGWLMRTRVAHRKTIRWLWNHSAAFQFLDVLKTRIQTQRSYERGRETPQTSPQTATKASAEQPDTAAEPRYDPGFAWDSEAWVLTRELMVKLKSETDAARSPLIVFQLPMLEQLNQPRPLPHQALRGFLAQHGIANADAFETLAGLSAQQKRALYLLDDVHLTAEGHRVFAEAVLPQLEQFLRGAGGRQP